MDIRNVATRHLHISCIRFFCKMQSWRQRTMTWCLLNRRSRHSRANRKKWHFARNPALARGTESRQKLREMSDFCLPSTPNSARAALRVEQNHPKLRKCSTRLPSPKQCDLRLQANSKKNVLPVTEVRCSDCAVAAQHCICQNHYRLRTNRWKWALCP